MIFKKVVIKNFGRFKEKEVTFGDKLNVVYGPNESGKTTLNWFIRGMLYGLEGGRVRKGGYLPPARRYEPWNGENYGGYLEYVLDNGALYRIERDFSTGTTTVYDSAFNDITHQFSVNKGKTVVVGDKHLGLDETGFEKTVFIDQLKTNPGEEGGAAIMDRLSNACLSGDEEVSLERARKALQDALRDMIGTEKTRTKPLNIVLANIEELTSRKKKLLAEKEAVLFLERTLSEYRQKAESIKCELDALYKAEELAVIKSIISEKKQKYNRLHRMIEEAGKLSREIDDLSCSVSLLEDVLNEAACFSECTAMDAATIQSDYRFLKDWTEDLNDLKKKLDNVIDRKEIIVKQIENPQYDFFRNPENLSNAIELSSRQEKAEAEADKTLKAAMGTRRAYRIFAAVALVTAVLSILGLFAALVVAVPSAIAWLFLFKSWRRKTSSLSEYNKLKDRLSEIYEQAGVAGRSELIQKAERFNNLLEEAVSLDTETGEIKNKINGLTSRVEDIRGSVLKRLESTGMIEPGEEPSEEHIEAFVEGVEKYLKTEKELSDKRNELAGKKREMQFLLERMSPEEGRGIADITDAKDFLSLLLRDIEGKEAEKTDKWSKIENSYPADIVRKITEIIDKNDNCEEVLKDEKTRLEEELRKLHLDIREYETRVESADPSRELQEIEGDLEALEEKRLYMEEVGSSIRTALEVIDEAADEIQSNYSPVLNNKLGEIITGMTLKRYSDLRADDDMRLNAHAPESGKIVSVLNLSGGTIDQMYLALRIAVSEIISGSGESLPLVMDEPFAQYDDKRLEKTIEYLMILAEKRQIIISTCKERELEKLIEITKNRSLLNIIKL